MGSAKKVGRAHRKVRHGVSISAMTWLLGCLSTGLWLIFGGKSPAPQSPPVVAQHYITKNIEDVRVGDYVLAKDPGDGGSPTPHRVIALPRNWTEHVVHVRVQGGAEIQATRMHPFWVEGKGWTNAVDIRQGDRLRDEADRLVSVESATVEDRAADTFNLTVDGVHTYYVLAGNTPLLVHNLIVVTPNGGAIPIPTGATGPTPMLNGKGFGYTGGSGGYGMSPSTSNVRIMDPTLPRGPSPGYPNGYVNYQNGSGQSINQYTGKTVGKSDPSWHQPCP